MLQQMCFGMAGLRGENEMALKHIKRIITGDDSKITGDRSGIHGDVSGISGYVTDIEGNATGLSGHVDDIVIDEEEYREEEMNKSKTKETL